MTTPTIAVMAAELKRDVDDVDLVRAFTSAMGWARTTLGRLDDDTLADLGGDNCEAVYGYTRDTLKMPKANFGYYSPDATEVDGLTVAAGDIGRRWAGQLRYGMRVSPGFG